MLRIIRGLQGTQSCQQSPLSDAASACYKGVLVSHSSRVLPAVGLVKLWSSQNKSPDLLQSDTTFILDSYLSIGVCICDVSTWANITGYLLLIESQRRSRNNPRSFTKGWSRGSDTVCLCVVLVSMSCYHSLQQNASQAERHTRRSSLPSMQERQQHFFFVHGPFFMVSRVFNLLLPSLPARSLTSTSWKQCKLYLVDLMYLPVSLLLHRVCSATVWWCSIFRNGS